MTIEPRPRLPLWRRWISRPAIAIDYLQALVRYRAFKPEDLDLSARGYLLDVLENGRLYVSTSAGFNDPWETAPALQPIWWQGDRHFQVAEFLKHLLPPLADARQYAQFLEYLRRLSIDDVLRECQAELMENLRQFPILCLNEKADNLLMWSYYANGHNGYALVFDARAYPFAIATKVSYSREHPRISLSRRDWKGIATRVLAVKAREWRHEKEWRLLLPRTRHDLLGFTSSEAAPNGGFYVTVPRETIVGVVLGQQLYEGPNGVLVLNELRKLKRRIWIQLAEIDRRRFRVVLKQI